MTVSAYAKHPRKRDEVPEDLRELEEFDWFNFTSTAPEKVYMPDYISVLSVKGESPYDRKFRMLKQLNSTCTACSMCNLGKQGAEMRNTVRDPHVLSNMNPVRFVVVGQNPGWDELEKREPFVGAAGKNFDDEIAKHGLDRTWFYICNAVRCWTKGNTKPDARIVERCEPFLRMELNLIKPHIVIALGAVAFDILCPGTPFAKSLGTITKSSKFNVSVFPIYHPSPVNFRDPSRRTSFEKQIKTMCSLVKALKKRHG